MHGLFRWSSKWWPGLIPLVVFWAFAAWTSTAPLEADLAARSNAALKDTVLDKKRIAVAGRDVSFAAEAFSEDGRQNAVGSVEAVPGVRLVNDETRLVPEAKPFVWSAERDVVKVTLGGSAPLPASKGRLLEAARAGLGGIEVADQMNLSRGAPPRFDSAALLLLDQIGKLKDGKITLSDTKVSLAGMARDLGGREAIAAALRNLPEGYSVAANDIKAPPYVFQAYKDPVAVTVTLTGYVPDNNAHAALVAAAGRKFFSEKVVDNLKASVGAPAGFANAVVPALGALSRLSTGTLVVSDREVKLSGDALYEAAAGQIRAGQGFSARLAVQGRNLGQAAGGAGRCHRLPAIVRRSAGESANPLRIRTRRYLAGFAWSARPPDRDGAALSDRQYRDRRPHRRRRRSKL
jgi:OOP family OmpA-OmpF porin